ncbi:MAG: RsmE family RNA methyltransferase [Bacillota bacterium]
MSKFFVKPEAIIDGKATITGDDAVHISRVLRMKTNDEIIICDSNGLDYNGIISVVAEKLVEIELKDSWVCENEPTTEITLFQGLPKGDKMDLIVQKCVELGVSRIVPMSTEFAVSKISDLMTEEKKLLRWNKISAEAAKQCGRGVLPIVENQMPIKAAAERAKEYDLVFVPYEKCETTGMTRLKELLQEFKQRDFHDRPKLAFYIGPEGGFSEKEIEMFFKNSVTPISLGKRILRTETAGMAVLSILSFEIEV